MIARSDCAICATCVEHCPSGCLNMIGTSMTGRQLLREIEKDAIGYRASGGGVTIGGGEPLMQYQFVTEVLALCRKDFINTAVETCGFTTWPRLNRILGYLDLLYFDLKLMDRKAHKAATKVPNNVILDNAKKAARICPTVFRIPVVPGINDTDENMEATGVAS